MKKTYGFMILGMFALVLFLGMTSALTSSNLTVTNLPTEILQDNTITSFTFDLESDVAGDVTISSLQVSESGVDIDFTPQTVTLIANTPQTITVNYNIPSTFEFKLAKDYSTTLSIENSSGTEVFSQVIDFEATNYCEDCSNPGNLKIDVEINVEEGYGDDDNYWYGLDKISFDVEIESPDYDVDDIEIEWALYNSAGKKIMDDTEKDFNLDENDDNTVTIEFILDEDLDDFENEDAILYVKAKGQIDDSNAGVNDEEDTCVSYKSDKIEVKTGIDFVIPYNLMINGESLDEGFYYDLPIQCGEEILLEGELWNIGDSDQDDPYLIIYNKELGINEKFEFKEVKAFDSEIFSIYLNIPEEMEETNYRLDLYVYDEDNDIFENSDDDESEKEVVIKVQGGCEIFPPLVSNGKLVSEAIEGDEMTFSVVVSNPNANPLTLNFESSGYDSWAEFVGTEPTTLTLASGQEATVLFKYNLKEDSKGEQTLNIKITSDSGEITELPVIVPVERDRVFKGDFFKDMNYKLAGIIALNVILLLLIILVIVKIARRR